MCGLAEASLASSVIGGVVTAYGQYQQGVASKNEANYRAAISRNNAIRANYMAEDALQRGKEAERKERLRGRMLLGEMRATLAANGQVVDSGSAGDLVVDQAAANKLDELTVRNNAEREAQQYRMAAQNAESEAQLQVIAGKNAQRSGAFASAGTLIATTGSVASKWYQFKKAGAFQRSIEHG